jgi:hypothetical protein
MVPALHRWTTYAEDPDHHGHVVCRADGGARRPVSGDGEVPQTDLGQLLDAGIPARGYSLDSLTLRRRGAAHVQIEVAAENFSKAARVMNRRQPPDGTIPFRGTRRGVRYVVRAITDILGRSLDGRLRERLRAENERPQESELRRR